MFFDLNREFSFEKTHDNENDWSYHKTNTNTLRDVSKFFVIVYILYFLQRRFNRIMHQFKFKDDCFEFHWRRRYIDDERHNLKQFKNSQKNSWIVRQMIHDSRIFLRDDQIRICAFSSIIFLFETQNDVKIFESRFIYFF